MGGRLDARDEAREKPSRHLPRRHSCLTGSSPPTLGATVTAASRSRLVTQFQNDAAPAHFEAVEIFV